MAKILGALKVFCYGHQLLIYSAQVACEPCAHEVVANLLAYGSISESACHRMQTSQQVHLFSLCTIAYLHPS